MPRGPQSRVAAAWAALTAAFALHMLDEATHDFLGTYNPVARAIRAQLGGVPFPPVFPFRVWLLGLLARRRRERVWTDVARPR